MKCREESEKFLGSFLDYTSHNQLNINIEVSKISEQFFSEKVGSDVTRTTNQTSDFTSQPENQKRELKTIENQTINDSAALPTPAKTGSDSEVNSPVRPPKT